MAEDRPCRVAVVGFGAIGRSVALRLAAGAVPGAELVGVVDHKPLVDADGLARLSLDRVSEVADVVVECAGQTFVRQHAVGLLGRGVDLVLCSVGALTDPDVRAAVRSAGPGRVVRPTGAIGGLDLLESAGRFEGFDRIRLTTTKLPAAVLQDWMAESARAEIAAATAPLEVFRGGARDACALFPSSVNVAAAVSLAIDDFDLLEVVIRADPGAVYTQHRVEASGPFGNYTFTFDNRPSPENPRTSLVVASSVLLAVAGLTTDLRVAS